MGATQGLSGASSTSYNHDGGAWRDVETGLWSGMVRSRDSENSSFEVAAPGLPTSVAVTNPVPSPAAPVASASAAGAASSGRVRAMAWGALAGFATVGVPILTAGLPIAPRSGALAGIASVASLGAAAVGTWAGYACSAENADPSIWYALYGPAVLVSTVTGFAIGAVDHWQMNHATVGVLAALLGIGATGVALGGAHFFTRRREYYDAYGDGRMSGSRWRYRS